MTHVFALVDCNNFYVSCERVFNSTLQRRPVVILSNNDGCIVARSNEAKTLGIMMGMPYFECKDLIECYDVAVYSSNYSLYQDMSNRVMRTLVSFRVPLEVYSIDEAFLDLSSVITQDLSVYGEQIRARIWQYTGIPVSIGIATTKTLAKIAVEIAKKQEQYQGICCLINCSEAEMDGVLEGISVEDVWGIGKKSMARLHLQHVFSAKDLKYIDERWARRHLTVAGERIVWELRGLVCIPLQKHAKPAQGIMSSLSFGRPVESLEELSEAIACHAAWAAEKLRKQESVARQISIFIHTNYFDLGEPQYAQSASRTLSIATAFTPSLIQPALTLLQHIYKPGYRYKKAGVYLSNIHPQGIVQPDLFGEFDFRDYYTYRRLMHAVDEINRVWGRDTIFLGAQGLQRQWYMRQQRRSQRYTTQWHELLTIPL